MFDKLFSYLKSLDFSGFLYSSDLVSFFNLLGFKNFNLHSSAGVNIVIPSYFLIINSLLFLCFLQIIFYIVSNFIILHPIVSKKLEDFLPSFIYKFILFYRNISFFYVCLDIGFVLYFIYLNYYLIYYTLNYYNT